MWPLRGVGQLFNVENKQKRSIYDYKQKRFEIRLYVYEIVENVCLKSKVVVLIKKACNSTTQSTASLEENW